MTRIWKALLPLLAILLSQVALWICLFPLADFLKQAFNISSMQRLITLLITLSLLVVAGFFKKRTPGAHYFPVAAWVVPLWFHVYFLVWLFLGGFSGENALMTTFSVLNVLIGLLVHWPMLMKKRPITISAETR